MLYSFVSERQENSYGISLKYRKFLKKFSAVTL